MITAIVPAAVLTIYAIIAAVVLPRLLGEARWADRAPRLAIVMWQAACASVIVSVLLAVFVLAVPATVVGHGLAEFFAACAEMLTDGPDLAMATMGSSAAVAGALILRVAWCAVSVLTGARAERRRHAEALALLGRHDGALDAIVVDFDERLAYCVPGRRGRAVITTAALRDLSEEEASAVIAHERAHLRGRHHLVLAFGEVLARAFPAVPLFERARTELARLVELLADDLAARRHPRIVIAAALVRLATGRAPAFTLGAGGETALIRVRRMLTPEPPLDRRGRLAGALAVGLLLAGPAMVALVPGFASLLAHHCHELLFA
ncbi:MULTISPECIES: M56 family metallopeptidase [unclassified Nonomuraea]|uniref:M56 family metallopeptidase n=1 Tax=unclassified Nonomuraea TaxID=2593643 RepID=UPI003406B02A